MTLSEAINKMTELTGQNLRLLQDINKSFTSDKSHIITQIGGIDFYVPSFIHLENKINHLQWAFDNLVKSPQHGEAWFNFDGNSRSIEVRGYQQAPARLDHKPIELFHSNLFNGFRDLLTPRPVIRFDLSTLPDDCRRVSVRKIVFYADHPEGDPVKASKVVKYRDVKEWMSRPESKDKYYIYDTPMELPFKQSAGFGSYTIHKVVNESLEPEQVVEIRLNESLNYTNSNYNVVSLEIGDKLTTWDGSARMEIIGLDRSDNTLNLRVQSGEYTNFIEHNGGDNISDYSRLRFYEPVDFKADKYLDVPLEEDQFVYICISPINDRLGTHSLWSDGLMINTHRLTTDRGMNFRKYYEDNVKNIGDIFQELIAVAPSAITKFSPEEYKIITATKIKTDLVHYSIHHTNKHLTDAESVGKLDELNKTSKDIRLNIAKVNDSIKDIEDRPTKTDEDTNKLKELHDTLNTLNTKLKENEDKIISVMKNPSLPVDTPEYHIMAWVDIEKALPETSTRLSIHDISHVEFRYAKKAIGAESVENIQTVLPRPYTHNTWVYGDCRPNDIKINYDAGQYLVKFNDIDPNNNVAKNNGFSIPIRPGESVVWQVRLAYRFGQPYTHVRGEWSDTITSPFPSELMPTLNPLQLIKDGMNELIAGEIIRLLGAKGMDFNAAAEAANARVNDALRILKGTNEKYTGVIKEVEKTIADLNAKSTTIDKRVKDLYGDINQPPKVSIEVNGAYVEMKHGETVSIERAAANHTSLKIMLEPRNGRCVLYNHGYSEGQMNINGSQKRSGLVWLDRVFGTNLLNEVKFLPTQFEPGNQQQSIQTRKIENAIEIPLEYDQSIGRGEIAFSIKYDPMREPLIYIINLHVTN